MIEFSTAIYATVGLLIYYTVFFVLDAIKKGSRATNTPNRLISELRTKYNVTIKTFNRSGDRRDGFSWFKCIWINESVFRNKNRLRFVFFHELYHLKHFHKYWNIIFRIVFSLEFLLLAFVPWYVFIVIAFSSCLAIYFLSMDEKKSLFEKRANAYAYKMIADEDVEIKGEKSN